MDDLMRKKISTRSLQVAIIGLGYVGLPLVLRFGEEHFPVLGFDVDPTKVRQLKGLSLSAAATPAGVSATYLQKLERDGVGSPSPRRLERSGRAVAFL